MSDVSRLTKAELIEEIERLRGMYEQCSDASGSNGKFDEDELFSLAMETEGDELFLVSETGKFVFVNDTMQQQLGYSREELLASSLHRIDKLNSRAQWLARVSRLKQSQEAETFESQQEAKDGTSRLKEITALYISYRSRNYILCVAREMEQEHEEREEPRDVRSREETLQQMTSDGVIIVDTRGTITESNAVADRLLGVTKNDIIGRSCVDSRWRLVDSAGAPLGISSHPIMVALVEEHQIFNRRIDSLTHDGSRKSMLVNAAPLHDVAGDLIGAIGFIRAYEDSAERSEQLQRMKMLQAFEREAMSILIESGSEHDLERKMCQMLVKHGDYPLVWRGDTQEKDERLHPTVSAGSEVDYLMRIKVRYDNSAFGNGPLGQAMKKQEVVVVSDTLSDPSSEPWRRQDERSHLHSLVAIPLRYGDKQLGMLALYSKDRHHFVGPELHTIKLVAEILAFGIYVRRRDEADREMRKAFAVQRLMLERYEQSGSVAMAEFEADDPFRCIKSNSAFLSLLDEPYHSSGVDGYYTTDFMYSLYHRDLYQQLQEVAQSQAGKEEEQAQFTDWQGKTMLWDWSIRPVVAESGETTLLYMAYHNQSDTNAEEEIPAATAASPAPVSVEQSASGDGAFLLFRYPKMSYRSKLETRIGRFLSEGTVVEATATALNLLEAPASVIGGNVAELLGEGEDMHAFLTELLNVKESGTELTFPFPAPDGRHCRVFLSSDEDAAMLCLTIAG